MAEVLGLATGTLSVFSLAIQIASSIKTLKDFVDVVKETPTEVRVALNEVEALSLVLQDIEQGVKDQTATSPAILSSFNKAVHLCKSSNDALEIIVREMNELTVTGKKWSSIKAALRRDKLARFRLQLEYSKTLLGLANQCYFNAVQRQDWKLQHLEMTELKLTLSAISSATSSDLNTVINNEPENRITGNVEGKTYEDHAPVIFDINKSIEHNDFELQRDSSLYLGRRLFGNFEFRKTAKRPHQVSWDSETSENGHTTEQRHVTIQLPTWLLPRRYHILSQRAHSGWDHKFRTYYVTASTAPIFQLCIDGNTGEIQKLFAAGLASPFNTDYNGFTTLHYAVSGGNLEVIRFLLQCGVDLSASSGTSTPVPFMFFKAYFGICTPLQLFSWLGAHLVSRKQLTESDHKAILQLLVDGNESCLSDIDGGPHGGHNPLQLYNGPVSSYTWLLNKFDHRLQYEVAAEPLWVSKFDLFFPNVVPLIRESLPNRHVSRDIVKQMDTRGQSILHYALQRWSHASSYPTLSARRHSDLKNWESLVRDILHAGADVHAVSSSGKTPFLVILSNSCRLNFDKNFPFPLHESRRSLRKAIKRWLEILRGEGFDMQHYKEREIQLWDAVLLKSWGITRIEFMRYDWVNIHWDKPEEHWNKPEEDRKENDYLERLKPLFDLYSMYCGEEIGEDEPPKDGSLSKHWYMVGGKYVIEDEPEDGGVRIPGSWVT